MAPEVLPMYLETKRLILRTPTEADAPDYLPI